MESYKNIKPILDFVVTTDINQKDSDYYWRRAISYLGQGDFDKAIVNFTQAIEINPDEADLYSCRAEAYDLQGNLNNALYDITTAIELSLKKNADFYNFRGDINFELDLFSNAIEDYNQVLEINPQDESRYNTRGICYEYLGKYAEAITDYTQAIKLNSDDEIFYYNRGKAYYKNGNAAMALCDYTKAAFEMEPSDEDIPDIYKALEALLKNVDLNILLAKEMNRLPVQEQIRVFLLFLDKDSPVMKFLDQEKIKITQETLKIIENKLEKLIELHAAKIMLLLNAALFDSQSLFCTNFMPLDLTKLISQTYAGHRGTLFAHSYFFKKANKVANDEICQVNRLVI